MAKPDSTASARRLTVLTTLGDIRAVKTFGPGGKELESYGRAKTFTHREIEIDRRGDWLRALGPESQSFVVLGEVIDKSRRKIRRLSSDRDGDEAQISDVPRSWMPLDIDQIDIDFGLVCDIDDIQTIANQTLRRLDIPGTQCVAHLSNSHGFNGKYRFRLWVELAEPATAAQMKSFWREKWDHDDYRVDALDKNGRPVRKPIVDPAVLQPQQPIYTGDPILQGVASPVKNRVAVIAGRPLRLDVARSKPSDKGERDDENIARLRDAGLYIRRHKPGQHCVRCPWEDEHSGEERDDDTFYFEPYHNGHKEPRFICHHATHKDSKFWSHVCEWMDEHLDDDSSRAPSWVYVTRHKAFFDERDGALIDREAFDAEHGGKSKQGTPTERFLKKHRERVVQTAAFVPGAERIFQQGRIKVLNTYIDMRVAPDATIDCAPWIEHIEWCVPGVADRDHLMDWLAWCYQHPEQKITWAPILFSSAHGVGKTTIFNCLAHCIGLPQVSEPTQAELEDKFNDWAFGKRLVKIEELMSGSKFHVAEKLKPIVANPTVSIRRMHQTGFSVPNMANVCASTNHMQALPIERSDRRYMLIQCVEAEPSVRQPRMRAFHAWLEQVGYGGIAHWLATRDVSHFVPTSEAPVTELKKVIARSSMTDFERAVDLCDVFDAEDVVSSVIVEEYLRQNDIEMRPNNLGNIAYRRGWKTPEKVDTRPRIGARRVTFWCPSGKLLPLQALLAKRPSEREKAHTTLAERVLRRFASSDE